MTATLLVDGHVHFYPCFGIEPFFDAARANFATAATQAGLTTAAPGCLLFAESAGHDYFRRFADGLVEKTTRRWTIRATAEAGATIACRDGAPALTLVRGRQVITAEGLEVLALATDRDFPDGQPLAALLGQIQASDALAVLAWGVGKWWGRRGRILQQLLRAPPPGLLFLGDNGGRPALAPAPRLFTPVNGRHTPILAGTDPLPLAWQAGRVGGYGFMLAGEFDSARPAASLRRLLCSPAAKPRTYGRLERPLAFARAAIALRMAAG